MSFNVVPIKQAAPEPGSHLDYALRYAALGWYVFPVWPGLDGRCTCRRFCSSPGKHPIEHLVTRGQRDATTDPTLINRWWGQYPDASIGVFLFPSGLLAIDIDPRNGGYFTMEILEIQHGELLSDVVSTTQGGGQHRIFSLSPEIKDNLPGKLGEGVDVKRNGYIVVPPSKGVLGEYIWEPSSDPLEGCIPSPLPDWLRDLAAPPAPVLEPGAQPGSRYATPEQVAELREALTYIEAEDRDTWINVGMALATIGAVGWELWNDWSQTSDKYDRQDQTRVWRSFKRNNGRNIESIFYEAQLKGWVNPLGMTAAPLPEPETVPLEVVKLYQAPRVPPQASLECDRIPGVLGLAEGWINATSRKLQPLFAKQAALAFGATVLGRHYVTNRKNWPSLYFLNIGDSVSGKEHAKWSVENLLESCGLAKLIGPDFYTSEAGVVSALFNQPSHITCVDEFGKVMEQASMKNSPQAASALKKLMEVFGRTKGAIRSIGYSTNGLSPEEIEKLKNRVVYNPALTLLGMSTPETFFRAISSSAVRDGFLNRFLTVKSNIGRQMGQDVDDVDVPDDIIAWSRTVHVHEGLIDPDVVANLAPNPYKIPFSPQARLAFRDFEARCLGYMDDYQERGLADMFGRTNEIAMRLSLVVALSCDVRTIGVDHADWAIQYVDKHAVLGAEMAKACVGDSDFEFVKNQVLERIIEGGERGKAEWELEKCAHLFRALNQRGQMDVLNSLAFVKLIRRVEIKGKRGPVRHAWVATQPEND